MTRILILMLGAMLTLAGCGGGSDGLEYGTPQVTVRGLESTVTVTVDGEPYLFQRNETHKFGKVQKNKNYRVNVSGNKSCGFTGSHSAKNDEVTQSASSKNANEHFIVRCDLSSDGTPGGGSGNDEDEDPSGHSISLELKDGVGANGNRPIEVNKPATVEVQLKDQNGNAVDGEPLVAYIQELPNAPKVGNLVNSTAITKDGGNASFQISAGKEAGVGRLVVVYYSESGDEIASKSITFETRGGETDSEEPTGPAEGELALSVEYGTGSEVTASSPATVKLTLTDESNAPVKGALVTFSLNSIDKVYGRLGTTSRLTNENGVAEVTLYAGRNAGAGSITARVEDGPPGSSAKVKGLRASAHFETKGDETDEDEPVGDAYSLEISSVANEVTADEAATITATLKDKDGGAVANELVVFNTQNGLGRLDPQIGTVQTDSEGKATITLHAGVTKGADKIRVIFEQGGKTYSASTTFTTKGDEAEGEEPADEAYTVTIDPITEVIDKDNPATVVATLKDENGVLPNELITFKTASGLGRLDPSSGTARTDSNGEARITLRAGDIRGADKLEVVFSKNNREYKAEVVFETKGDEDLSGEPADDNYVVQVDPISSEIEAGAPVIVRATVKDSEGSPVKDELVVFTTTNGVGRLDPAIGTAKTDNDGIATIELHAGTVPGSGRIIATFDDNYKGDAVFTTKGNEELAGAEFDADINFIFNPDNKIPVGGSVEVEVTVTSNDPDVSASGQLVQFSSDLGVIEPSSGTVLTDSNGKATITLHAGEVAGAGQLTATFMPLGSSLTKSKTFNFYTEGGKTYELELDATRGKTSDNLITESSPSTITATLKQAGAVASDVSAVVTFTTEVGRFEVDGRSANTYMSNLLNGEAIAVLKASDVAGAGRLTASVEVDGETYNASIVLVSAGDEERDVVEQQPTLALTLVKAGTTDALSDSELSKAEAAEVLIKLELNGADLVLEEQMIRFTTVTGAVLDKETVMLDEDGEARVIIVPTDLEGAGTLVAVLEGNSSVTATRHFATKGDGHPSGEEPYPVTIELTIEQDGVNVNEVDNTKPATVQIELVGDPGDIANRLVTVASTVGSVAPTTVLTDGDGKASTTLNTKNIWNAGVITATLQSNEGETLVAKSKSFGIKGEMPGEVSIEIELTDNNGAPIGTPQAPITRDMPANIKVTVKQGTDEIAGELVRVSSDLGELSPASGTTITNDDGEATSLILRAGNEAGAGTLTASIIINGVEYEESVYFLTWGANNYDPNEPLVLELDLKGQETGNYPNSESPITDSNPAKVTATLTRGGIAIPEALIHFETDLGVIKPSTGTALTDAAGMAEVILQIADESGAGTITATYDKGDGLVVEKHFEMTQTKDGLQLSELVLLDSSGLPGNGVVGKELSETNMAVARVRLVDDSGAPKPNEIIYFNIENNDHGVLDSPSALTDNQGYAEVNLRAGTKGAARLVATYNWKGVELRRSTPFMSLGGGEASDAIKPALGYRDAAGDFHDGKLQLVDQLSATGPVDAGSTVAIGVDLVKADDTSVAWSGVAKVELGSICTDNGTAQLDDTVTLINGRGVATYKAVGTACAQDQVWAKIVIEEKELNAFTEIFDIEHSPAGFIEFEGSEHEKISLKGASAAGLDETTTLTFLVKNQHGQTVAAGEKVNFSAVNALGGFKLNAQSALTNNEGIVEVQVASGTVPYTAIVRAELDEDPNVFAHGKIPVTTGVVTQDRFILSLSDHNPLAWNNHLAEVTVNVSAADRMGNLADGTVVYFTTKLGQIEDECVISDGKCSVTWRSGGSQPIFFDENRQGTLCEADYLKAFEQGVIRPVDCEAAGVRWGDRYGRNVITAYTAGEESFRDDNGNNIFDLDGASTERYVSLTSEVFRDDNVTGKYEDLADEFHIIPELNPANTGKFHGVGCSEDAVAEGHCETLTHVRRSVEMTLSTEEFVGRVFGSEPNFNTIDWNYSAPIGSMMTGAGTPPSIEAAGIPYTASTIYIAMHDAHGASPGSGSSISIDEGDRELITTTCGTVKPTQTEVYICEAKFKAMKLVDVLDGNGDPTGDKALENQDPDPVRITLTNGIDTQEIVLGVDTTGL